MITTNELRARILMRLSSEPLLKSYTVVKSKNYLTKRDDLGLFVINLNDSYSSVDTNRNNEFSLCVSPGFRRRFNILEEWFERNFYLKDREGIKYRFSNVWLPHLDASPENNYWERVDFLRERDTFEDDYQHLLTIIANTGLSFFSVNTTLEGMYQQRIKPVIEGKQSIDFYGFDWVPTYLSLAKITHPEQYQTVKNVVLQTLQGRLYDLEVDRYKDSIPAILNYIDKHTFV